MDPWILIGAVAGFALWTAGCFGSGWTLRGKVADEDDRADQVELDALRAERDDLLEERRATAEAHRAEVAHLRRRLDAAGQPDPRLARRMLLGEADPPQD